MLYTVNATSPQHRTAKTWLDDALSGDTRLGLPWLSLLAFVRIAKHPSLFPRPLSVGQALEIVDPWCEAPNVVHPEPSHGFAATFDRDFARLSDVEVGIQGVRHDAAW